MASQAPDQFLTSGPDSVTVNDAGAWKAILDHEGFTVKDSSGLTAESPDSSEGNVWIAAGSSLLGLEFSSERNERYFVVDLEDAASRKNNAWIGDENGCKHY